MEYVDGLNILEFAQENPSMIADIFEGVIDGFSHLEEMGILHRDIRAGNILVDRSGKPKIIDFGFGKKIQGAEGGDSKSITLNWWCEKPPEFKRQIYDLQTEVYFIGKLFEEITLNIGASEFKYREIVASMCERDRNRRRKTFSEVRNAISEGRFEEISFSNDEKSAYRDFANSLHCMIALIDPSEKFERDIGRIISRMQHVHNCSILEEYVPSPEKVTSIFLKAPYKFWSKSKLEAGILRRFLYMFKSLTADKQSIVLENLLSKLGAIDKINNNQDNDEIPF